MAKAAEVKVKTKPVFRWSGVDHQGEKVSGEIEAASLEAAKEQLSQQRIKIRSVRKKVEIGLFSEKSKKITPMDLAVFTRQLATMMQAGVPIVQAFDLVAGTSQKDQMKQLLRQLRAEVAGGNLISSAMRKHPQYFDPLFCQLVMVGEQSGTLDIMLDRIASYKEKTELLKGKIKKAMTYPAAVVIVAIIVTGILLVKVVPQFEALFQGFGADLPAFTQMVLGLSEVVQDWWWAVLLAAGGGVFLFRRAMRINVQFRHQVQRKTLSLPVIGKILHNACIARFSRTLHTTYASGVPMIEALTSSAGATNNAYYEKALLQAKRAVAGGQSLRLSLQMTGILPPMVIQMIGIGEEAGSLEIMLDKLAIYYEAEVDNAIDSLTSLLEPMIMAVIGVLVGGLIIAMYLPIFQLGSVV